jgi:DNA-directed RNA polymerase specialized sigma24 family protein
MEIEKFEEFDLITEALFTEQFNLYYLRTVKILGKKFYKRGLDPEDIASSAWALAWEKKVQFEGRCKFYVWVVKIAIRLYLDRLRIYHPTETLENYPDPSYKMGLEASITLEQLLSLIPACSRDRLVAGYIEGTLDVSDGALKSALHRDRGLVVERVKAQEKTKGLKILQRRRLFVKSLA